MFTSTRSNPKGAQLLFTTHDVSLMEHLRRDEVALVNKPNDGASRLELMAEYKLLRRDDMQKVYMEGRVGGLPRLGSLGRALTPHARGGVMGSRRAPPPSLKPPRSGSGSIISSHHLGLR
jgi:hypothetical protein